jgi:hypothetical protein
MPCGAPGPQSSVDYGTAAAAVLIPRSDRPSRGVAGNRRVVSVGRPFATHWNSNAGASMSANYSGNCLPNSSDKPSGNVDRRALLHNAHIHLLTCRRKRPSKAHKQTDASSNALAVDLECRGTSARLTAKSFAGNCDESLTDIHSGRRYRWLECGDRATAFRLSRFCVRADPGTSRDRCRCGRHA